MEMLAATFTSLENEASIEISLMAATVHCEAVRSRLAQPEQRLRQATPGELDWAFWNEILELVEELSPEEEQRWKHANLARLRLVVGGPEGEVLGADEGA